MAVKTKKRNLEIPDTIRVNADEVAVGHTNGNGNGHFNIKKVVRRRMKPLEGILTKAIEALKTYGWTREELGAKAVGMCLVGAIQYAATGDTERANVLSDEAIARVYESLPRKARYDKDPDEIDRTEAIINFNDGLAENRGQVLQVLRRALAKVK